MPQNRVDLGAVDRFLESQEASMTKNATQPKITIAQPPPPAPGMPEGFVANLQQEFNQGMKGISEGVGTVGASKDIRGIEQMGGVGQAALGALQTINAPVTAAARASGQTAQDIVQPIAGETAGAVAGTIVDTAVQMLGGPAMGKVARETAKFMSRITPGFYGASRSVRRAIMSEDAQLLPSLVTPSGVDTKAIYDKLDTIYKGVPVKHLEKLADHLAVVEARAGSVFGKTLESTPIKNIATELRSNIQAANANNNGRIPFNDLSQSLKRINEKIRAMPEEGRDELYGAYMQMKKGIYDDMEKTAVKFRQGGMTKEAFKELRKADAAYRRESAADDLQHFVSMGTKYHKGNLEFDADSVLTKIHRNQYFQDSLKDEGSNPTKTLDTITDTLKNISKRMPDRPPEFGEHAVMSGILAGGAGALSHFYGAGPALTAPQFAGGPTGIAGVTFAASIVIGEALKTRPGQAMLRKLFSHDKIITREKLAALSVFVRGATEGANRLSMPGEQTVQVPQQ